MFNLLYESKSTIKNKPSQQIDSRLARAALLRRRTSVNGSVHQDQHANGSNGSSIYLGVMDLILNRFCFCFLVCFCSLFKIQRKK